MREGLILLSTIKAMIKKRFCMAGVNDHRFRTVPGTVRIYLAILQTFFYFSIFLRGDILFLYNFLTLETDENSIIIIVFLEIP